MTEPHFLRFLSWTKASHLAALEGLLALVAASIAIRALPFRSVAGLASRWGQSRRLSHDAQDARVRMCCWAIEEWARRVPWKTVCFQKGLALQMMLRRRRVASTLHYGIAQTGAAGLRAHVWISVGGEVVLGGQTVAEFACLATFPATEAPGT